MKTFKIVKTKPSSWQGVGFGVQGASYAVQENPLIRIIRATNGWYAYIGNNKFFGLTKIELELELSKKG